LATPTAALSVLTLAGIVVFAGWPSLLPRHANPAMPLVGGALRPSGPGLRWAFRPDGRAGPISAAGTLTVLVWGLDGRRVLLHRHRRAPLAIHAT
jgi:hypothetical protein